MAHAIWKEEYKSQDECRGFMYGVEYGYHLGQDCTGVRIYPSIEALYEDSGYANKEVFPQDGIVEVQLKFIRHIPAEKCWEEKERNKENDSRSIRRV